MDDGARRDRLGPQPGVDTLIFITLAFYGQFPIGSLLLGQALAKVVLSVVLVPPLIALAVGLARKYDPRAA